MTLGQKIKSLRNEKGITQKGLADKLQVTFQTVSKWENDENEPDVATLKELAKIFERSLDSLLSDEEAEESKEGTPEVAAPAPVEPKKEVVIIHQKELHVCERCKKDIEEGDLEMEQVTVTPGRRGRAATYRQAYYHKACLDEVKKERMARAAAEKKAKASSRAKKSFGWGIAGGVVALVVSLLSMLMGSDVNAAIHPAEAVLISIGFGYSIFAGLYCIISGSYVGDVFLWCAGISFKAPGIIFTWDLDGFVLIVMKILFAVIAFFVGLFAIAFAIVFSMTLGAISFPFVLMHNNHTNYEDAL